MSEVKETVDKLIDAAGDILETHKEITIIKFLQHSTTAASSAIVGAITLIVVLLFLLFSGMGIAWWAGEKLGDMKMGFLIIGGSYLIILLLLILSTKRIIMPLIRNILIQKIYEED